MSEAIPKLDYARFPQSAERTTPVYALVFGWAVLGVFAAALVAALAVTTAYYFLEID
jgi:hypothetical protein